MLRTNCGLTDRMMRICIGLLLISLVFFGTRTPWGWLGVLPLATGLMGWCPLYSMTGHDTREESLG